MAGCLHSLLAQTRIPDEILVINSASSDRTGQVAMAIPERAGDSTSPASRRTASWRPEAVT